MFHVGAPIPIRDGSWLWIDPLDLNSGMQKSLSIIRKFELRNDER